jgi:hypothetical protein
MVIAAGVLDLGALKSCWSALTARPRRVASSIATMLLTHRRVTADFELAALSESRNVDVMVLPRHSRGNIEG